MHSRFLQTWLQWQCLSKNGAESRNDQKDNVHTHTCLCTHKQICTHARVYTDTHTTHTQVHKRISIFNLRMFVYNIRRFIRCFLKCFLGAIGAPKAYEDSYSFLIIDNYKFTANNVRDKDHKITKIHHFATWYKHLNNILSRTFVYGLTHRPQHV